MSVTRYIEKNTPVQVNSHLIGVEVYPDDVITGIDVSGHFTRIVGGTVNENSKFWTSTNTVVYSKGSGSSSTVTIDETTYYRWNRSTFWGDDSGYPKYLWITAQTITSSNIGDTLYTIDQTDPDNPVVSEYSETLGDIVPAYAGPKLNTIQLQYVADDDLYILGLEGDVLNTQYIFYPSDSSIRDNISDQVVTVFSSKSNLTNKQIACDSYVQEDEDTGYWIDSDNATYNGPLYGSATPEVGDTLDVFIPGNEFNQQTVGTVNTESGTANCVVEYSVTGDEWTQVGSNLTDVNNVIANIPKYVYLRFSQDVEITEE